MRKTFARHSALSDPSRILIYLAHPVFSVYQAKGAITTKRYIARTIDRLLGHEVTVKTNLPSFGRITAQTVAL